MICGRIPNVSKCILINEMSPIPNVELSKVDYDFECIVNGWIGVGHWLYNELFNGIIIRI